MHSGMSCIVIHICMCIIYVSYVIYCRICIVHKYICTENVYIYRHYVICCVLCDVIRRLLLFMYMNVPSYSHGG